MVYKNFKAGVWSAAPTPFTKNGNVDSESIKRLTEHHLRLGVNGVFLCGTSGEGPWITPEMSKDIAVTTVKAAAGNLKVTIQVTDNSSIRILDNIARFADIGVDSVIMAAPFFQRNETQEYLKKMFLEVLDKSPLPVGFYHLGKFANTMVETETAMQLMEHPNLIILKDSTGDKEVMKQFVTHAKTLDNPPLLLNGNEFDTVPYLQAGYDGALYGGACFNGYMSNLIFKTACEGDFIAAQSWQDRMSKMMTEIFGGKGFPYWLAAQKQVLVELGVFNTNKTIINYSLPPEGHKVLQATIEREKEFLLP